MNNEVTMNIKELGEKFATHLHNTEINLTENGDGRLESLNSEDDVTDSLRENFKDVIFLEKGHNRSFGDIDVEIDEGVFPPTGIQTIFPINIKMIDETTGSYNGGGPKVFNYVLFGGKQTTWKDLVKRVKENKPTTIHSEYFYLVYYKRSNKKPQFISLTDIHRDSIVTNPTNPIQLKQNLKYIERTESEKVDFMLELLEEVLYKRAEPYMLLKDVTW
jgi:hypothetical protein